MHESDVVPCLVCDEYMKSAQCCKEWNNAKYTRLPIRLVPNPCPEEETPEADGLDGVRRCFDHQSHLLPNPSLDFTLGSEAQVRMITETILEILKKDPEKKAAIELGVGVHPETPQVKQTSGGNHARPKPVSLAERARQGETFLSRFLHLLVRFEEMLYFMSGEAWWCVDFAHWMVLCVPLQVS